LIRAMTTLEAFILGIVQGITEFFPVSSSGHLKVAEALFGFKHLDRYILFDLVCHLGTLLAILIVFSLEVRRSLTIEHARLKQIALATLPLFLLIPVMGPVKAIFNKPEYLGLFFLATALLLTLGMRCKEVKPKEQLEQNRWRDALFIGLFQLFAIFPGISRSGSTISAAWMRGWQRRDAVVFSFLIAIPAIVGGSMVELLQLYIKSPDAPSLGSLQYTAGFVSSFAVGYGALIILVKLAIKERFQYFVWYCLIVGLWSLWYFNR